MHVEGILSRKGHEVATIVPDTSVRDAVQTLAEHRIGALVVSEDGEHITGILSERDVVRGLAASGPDLLDADVASIMTSEVQTCRPTDTVARLMSIMTGGRFRHLPVVDGDGRVTGIISIGDVVKERLTELETEAESLKDYVRQGW